MLHRYVALFARPEAAQAFQRATDMAKRRYAGWAIVLETETAIVWSLSEPPSSLGHRVIGRRSVLLGADFGGRSHSIDVDVALEHLLVEDWGAYVAFRSLLEPYAYEVLRDPTGRIPCWRMKLQGVDVYFSHYPDVRWLQDRPLEINWDFIQYHLNMNFDVGCPTGYIELQELLPGQRAISRAGDVETEAAWDSAQIALEPFTDRAMAENAIRAAAETSAEAWSSLYDTLLLNLSGGLDSSILLGLLNKVARGKNIVLVNHVTSDAEGDERRYARDAAAFNRLPLIEQTLTAQDIGEAPSFSMRVLRPTVRVLSLGYDEYGERHLRESAAGAYFTGIGGDHLFQLGIGLNATVDCWRRTGSPMRTLRTAHQLALMGKDTVWSALRYMAARAPAGQNGVNRLSNEFVVKDAREEGWTGRFIAPKTPAFDKLPPSKRDHVLSASTLHWQYARYGRADAADEVHPFVSQPLIEACLRTPSEWFLRDGIHRGLQRALFADIIPASVRWRRTKGYNTTHWIEVLEKSLPKMRDYLLDGELVRRGWLDRSRLEAALTPAGLAHARECNTLATCYTTELWVRQAFDDQSSARLLESA